MSATKEKKDHIESDRATKRSKVENGTAGYLWSQLHQDLEDEKVIGVHGACNSTYHGLAEIRGGVDMSRFHKKRSESEVYIESLNTLLKREGIRERWNQISTFDPMGMYATHPTMAATTSNLTIPELKLVPDGKVVNPDGTIITTKIGIEYVWNLPLLAAKLQMDEKKMRTALYKYTHIENMMDESRRAFLPPVGGLTLYFFGDVTKLADSNTEVAVRVHDECNGSDVFGTDICTCRPYLVFGIQGAVECAQRGGVGIIAYFRKEGRSLGEVTKFRVYNARKAQAGGDRPETYFSQTESIAGIRDARFQEMMPDFLNWLGIKRIDWLLSMSSEKYDAIVGAGIEVMQRVALPDMYVPKGAEVELTAKISAGYHTEKIESEKVIDELRGLPMIRERCNQIYALAKEGKTKHLALDSKKIDSCAEFVVKVMKSNYPTLDIPYHSRWRHFPDASVKEMTAAWPCGPKEKCRRQIDLAMVSVLMDAGAGSQWKYIAGGDSKGEEKVWTRSEGLAVATLDMFKDGLFSSDVALPHRVNAAGLKKLTKRDFSHGFQVTNTNPLDGLEGRYRLIQRLAKALKTHPEFFGKEVCRPGHIVDYCLLHAKDGQLSINTLWRAVIEGLESIWPNTLSGVRRGDVWVYNPLKKIKEPASDMIPFHKLSQWLTLSFLEPLEQLGLKIVDLGQLTALAEYRNGGLLVDSGVLTLKNPQAAKLVHDVGSELIVEWRALTVAVMDDVADRVRKLLNKDADSMPLMKILQGGTWAAGRLLATEKRGKDAPPPIIIRSDGSVF